MDIDQEKAAHALSSPFIVGALGALVALKGTPGDTWRMRAFNVVCGALIAGFGAPALCEFFSLSSGAMQGAMSFVAGLFGMNIVAMVSGWTKTIQLSDVVPWIKGKGQ